MVMMTLLVQIVAILKVARVNELGNYSKQARLALWGGLKSEM